MPWFSEYGFQQTRGFRALKLWMVLAQMGRTGVAEHISSGNRQATLFAELISEAPDFETLVDPTLSIVCFRYRPAGRKLNDEALNDLNRQIMYKVQESGELFLTQADLGNCFALRACFINYVTSDEDVRAILPEIRRAGSMEHEQLARACISRHPSVAKAQTKQSVSISFHIGRISH